MGSMGGRLTGLAAAIMLMFTPLAGMGTATAVQADGTATVTAGTAQDAKQEYEQARQAYATAKQADDTAQAALKQAQAVERQADQDVKAAQAALTQARNGQQSLAQAQEQLQQAQAKQQQAQTAYDTAVKDSQAKQQAAADAKTSMMQAQAAYEQAQVKASVPQSVADELDNAKTAQYVAHSNEVEALGKLDDYKYDTAHSINAYAVTDDLEILQATASAQKSVTWSQADAQAAQTQWDKGAAGYFTAKGATDAAKLTDPTTTYDKYKTVLAPSDSDDAASLPRLLDGAGNVKAINAVRTPRGFGALKVSDILMAVGVLHADYGNANPDTGHQKDFPTAENLMGMGGTTAAYHMYQDNAENGSEVTDCNALGVPRLTASTWQEWFVDQADVSAIHNVNYLSSVCGHYLNYIAPAWSIAGAGVSTYDNSSSTLSSYTATEFVQDEDIASSTFEQNIGRTLDADAYYRDLLSYIAGLKARIQKPEETQKLIQEDKAKLQTSDEQAKHYKQLQAAYDSAVQAEKQADARLTAAQSAYDNAVKQADAAQSSLSQAKQDYESKATAYQQAKQQADAAAKQADSARQALGTAKQATATAQQQVDAINNGTNVEAARKRLAAAQSKQQQAARTLTQAQAKADSTGKALATAKTRYDKAKAAYDASRKPTPTGTVTMWRLYNPNSGEHFYTATIAERDHLTSLGWRSEGVGWKAPADGDPVYRLYNPNAGDHHYTLSSSERDWLVSLGWNYEGVGWRSATASNTHRQPLYRQYNPNAKAGAHNYTLSKAENDMLKSLGWHAEGLAWYAAE